MPEVITTPGGITGFKGNYDPIAAQERMRLRKEIGRGRTVSSRGGEQPRRTGPDVSLGRGPSPEEQLAAAMETLRASAHGLTPDTFVMPQAGGGRQAAALGLIAAPQAPINSTGEALPTGLFPQIPTSVQVPISEVGRTEVAEGFPSLFTQMPTGALTSGSPSMPDIFSGLGTDQMAFLLQSLLQQILGELQGTGILGIPPTPTGAQ